MARVRAGFKQSGSVGLRPEAQAAKWTVLDDAQRQAVRRLVQMIAEAIDGLPLPSEQASAGIAPSGRQHRSEKKSRTAFLSGDRGTGKTTVLHSLIKFSSSESDKADLVEEDLAQKLRKLKERVIWLDELDMEPIKHPPSFLMAIFARIEAAFFQSNAGGSIGGSEQSDMRASIFPGALTPGNDSLIRFKRLQADIAVSWDSNIAARKGHLDADSYAVELMREEKARLSLGRDLDRVLDDLAREGFVRTAKPSPLFVLPVDDLDLNPQSCLHLLRLLRQISTPRIFFVVLGDESLAELVINLQVSNDLASLASGVSRIELLSVSPQELAGRAGNVAANALRKLLPPAQRVHLEPMTLLEAAYFRPLVHPDADSPEILPLHQIMANLQVPLPFPAEGGNVRDLLFGREAGDRLEAHSEPPAAGDDNGLLHDTFYSGRFLLKAPPRRLADLWLALNEIAYNSHEDGQQRGELVEYFALKCRRSLLGDPAVGPAQRRAVEYGIEKNDDGQWELRSLPIRLISETNLISERVLECPAVVERRLREVESREEPGPPSTTSTPEELRDEVERVPELRFRFCSVPRWRFEVEASEKSTSAQTPESGSVAQRELDFETASELTILHDLLASRSEYRESSSLVSSLTETEAWARTVWNYDGREPAAFPWPLPICTTIWALDWFRKQWNGALQRSQNRSADNLSTKDQDTVTLLALRWIISGTSILLDRTEITNLSEVTRWHAAEEALNELATKVLTENAPPRAAHWICSVCSLLMPEMGILSSFRRLRPVSIADRILRSEAVSEVCRRFRFILQRQRAERFSALLAAGNEQLYLTFDELTPSSDQKVFRPPQALVYRLANLPIPRRRRVAAEVHPTVEATQRMRAAQSKK